MRRDSKKRARKKAFIKRTKFLLIVTLVIVSAIYICTMIGKNPMKSLHALSKKAKETKITISAIGDCALGRDHRLKYENSNDDVFARNNNDFNYFFSEVVDIFSKDDLTIANLESALTKENKIATKYDYGNNYWFKGDPIYANVLKAANIETVCLANNHTYDYLQKGYDDTKESLKNVGVGYFGYDDLYETEIKGIKIGIAGFNQLGEYEQGTNVNEFKADIKKKIEVLKGRNDFVIACIHWGKEYVHEYTQNQKDIGHFTIDCGADLILGAHPHVIQGIEKYKDKYIVYSLGNFCFGGNKNPPDYDTFIYQQEITFNPDKSIAKISEPNYIPCSISSTKNINNYKPIPSKGKDIVRILNKINKYSDYKISEDVIKSKGKANIVNLKEHIPNILLDLKYASTDNITGEILYKSNEAFLRKETADKLKVANEILNKQGYKIKIWDAYRPSSVQQQLWEKATNKQYFMDPKIGSNHTKGCTVDITMTDLNGVDVDMPSGFDDMTGKATRKYRLATPTQKQNALLLEKAMLQAGFKSINTEWWHFDDSDWKLYDFIDESEVFQNH